jgi:outer membrane protein assembly factor BamB
MGRQRRQSVRMELFMWRAMIIAKDSGPGILKQIPQLRSYSGNFSSPAISADGTVYIGSSNDRHLYAINSDGTLKWKFTTGAIQSIDSSPAIAADGTIYLGSADGNLYAVGGAAGLQ